MVGVREYHEEEKVYLSLYPSTGVKEKYEEYRDIDQRLTILAYNEAGCNSTGVDLIDVINWVKKNRPELL